MEEPLLISFLIGVIALVHLFRKRNQHNLGAGTYDADSDETLGENDHFLIMLSFIVSYCTFVPALFVFGEFLHPGNADNFALPSLLLFTFLWHVLFYYFCYIFFDCIVRYGGTPYSQMDDERIIDLVRKGVHRKESSDEAVTDPADNQPVTDSDGGNYSSAGGTAADPDTSSGLKKE